MTMDRKAKIEKLHIAFDMLDQVRHDIVRYDFKNNPSRNTADKVIETIEGVQRRIKDVKEDLEQEDFKVV